jgi:hypothetical protein
MENTTSWLTNEISSTEISRKTSQDAHAARVARSAGSAGVCSQLLWSADIATETLLKYRQSARHVSAEALEVFKGLWFEYRRVRTSYLLHFLVHSLLSTADHVYHVVVVVVLVDGVRRCIYPAASSVLLLIPDVIYEWSDSDNDRVNRGARRNPCPSATLSPISPILTDPSSNQGTRCDRPAANRLRHVTSLRTYVRAYIQKDASSLHICIKVKQSRYTPWRRLGGEEV